MCESSRTPNFFLLPTSDRTLSVSRFLLMDWPKLFCLWQFRMPYIVRPRIVELLRETSVNHTETG